MPREHWLAEAAQLRATPSGLDLDEVCLHRAQRTVRQDGTVRFAGEFFEVRPELVDTTVELRFDPSVATPRPRVFLDGRFLCDAVPLDRRRNARRARRRDLGQPDPTVEPTGLDPLAQILDAHYERTRPPRRSSAHDAKQTKKPHKKE